MKKLLTRKILVTAFAVVMVAAVATSAVFLRTGNSHAAPAAAPSHLSTQQIMSAAHADHLSGVVVAGASTITGGNHKPPVEPPFNGTPPLFFRGAAGCFSPPCFNGNVLMTQQTGPLVVVPIFWVPAGFSMSSAYKNIITSYITDVAKDSGLKQNVYSVANEYSGINGQIQYNVKLGPVITDTTDPITNGCTVGAQDTSGIYVDGSGYSACVDDAQLQTEVDNVTAANSLPHDFSHMYVVYLPKAVESCFFPGDSTTNNVCTINHYPTAAFCAYHNNSASSSVYANMVYPIYQSPVGFTCGTDARFPVIQSPNGNPDADTEISPTSHEIIEAITDPDGETGWGDSSGNEIGDDCAYVYGRTRGATGAYFNQVINGGKFLTQEEFSNNLFASSGGTAGCLQGE